jgi:predicted dehydrogenase
MQEVLAKIHPKIIFCEKPLVSNINEAKKFQILMSNHRDCKVVPNISRRWNPGLQRVSDCIKNKEYGTLEKIHIRYTRGIYNTGAHLFDLLKMWTSSQIKDVQVLKKVYTSSEKEGEPSFTFFFEQEDGVYGYAEAMNDEQYYLFDIDLFFTEGKIEMKSSGDEVLYYGMASHHLFTGYRELKLEKSDKNLLAEPCLSNAVTNLVGGLSDQNKPLCMAEDAIYPLYVAEALLKSYENNKKESVSYDE